MEENLMERLLNDFNGVLDELNQLVVNKDIEGAKRFLNEVNRLIQDRDGIVLDDREPEYDHVLHELLSKMSGIIEREITIEGIDGVQGSRYYTNDQVREMIEEAEKELADVTDTMNTYKDVNDEYYAQARSKRSALIERIANLKASIVEGQEFSTLTYIDPRVEELQKERATLIEEKRKLLAEIEELENGNGEVSQTTEEVEKEGFEKEVIQARIDSLQGKTEIDALVADELSKVLALADETGHVSIEDINAAIEALNNEKARLEAGETVVTREVVEVDASKIDEIIQRLQTEVEVNRNLRQVAERTQVADFGFADELEGYIGDLNAIKEAALSGETELVGLSEEEINKINEENERLQQEILDAQEELNRMKARLEELTGDKTADLRTQMEDLRNSRNDYAVQIKDLRKQLKAIEKRIKDESVQVKEPVLDPMDYTYMGRLEDKEIIRRLLSEQLHLSEEEINETIDQYSLEQYDAGAHDEYGEDNPISMRQLVRTTTKLPEVPDVEKKEPVLDPMDYTYMGRLTDEQIIRRLLSEQLHLSEEEINETIDQYSLEQYDAGAHDEYGEDNPISMRQLVRKTKEPGKSLEEQKQELENKIKDLKAEKEEKVEKPLKNIASQIRKIQKEEIKNQLESKTSELNELKERFGITDETNISEELENLRRELEDYEREQAEGDIGDHDNRITTLTQRISTLEHIQTLQGEVTELTDLQSLFARTGKKRDLTNLISQNKAQIKANNLRKEGKDQQAISEARRVALVAKIQASIDKIEADLPRVQEGNYTDKIAEYTYKLELLRQVQEQVQGLVVVRTQTEQVVDPSERLKVIDATLVQLEEISQEKTKYMTTVTKVTEGPEKNQKEIDARKRRIAEIDRRVEEIDKELEGISGIVPPRKKVERLDIGEEAQKIGDHIFKAARIRRELAERNVTRDEFLAFYEAGLKQTTQQIEQLQKDSEKMITEMSTVVVDKSGAGKPLNKQIEEAEKAGNTELATKLYEQLRKNFIKVGREDQLKEKGLDHEITSSEDVAKMKEFFDAYKTSVEDGYKKIQISMKELGENQLIFQREIERINNEKTVLEVAGGTLEELQEKSEERKDLRRRLLEASITPENELTDEQIKLLDSWQEASERFLSKRTTGKYVYIDKDGNKQELDVDTIEGYEGYEKDVDFLGVPAYKENLEQLSAYNQTKDPYVFGKEVGEAYEAAEAEREGAGEEVLARIMADKQKYVDTFNGIPNPHKVKYENWKTAGSTLKGMKPVSRDLPATTRAKNALENVGRFFGIRVPKFTRLDEHGNEVRDVAGGVATLAVDGLVIGAVAGTALTLGPAVAAIGYAAKGIVTAGNRIAARVEYSRHKDEIDGNLPVINQADSNAREVARKEYYREQGDNRFVSWVKAKADKYFTRGRAKETEAAIVDGLVSQFEEAEDARTESLRKDVEIAQANQEARLKRQKQIAMGANTYNDVVRDPDSVDMDKATAAIARNAALEASRQGKGKEDVNPDSKVARREQYVKQEGPVAKTNDLSLEGLENVEGPVSAITEEQIYTGRKQYVDRLNKVLTMLTAAGLKFAYTAWKDGFTETDIIHHDAETKTETIHHEAEYGEVEVTDYQTQYDTSKTLDELRQNYAGKTADEYYSVSGGLRGQRTEPLVDRGITAGWYDDKSAWGTGLSDSHGLSAPVLTDRLADAGLLDANGVLRQDITVQDFLDAMGCKNADLTTLDGIYMSVGDKYWVSLADLMKGMTKEVAIGSHTETQLIKAAWDETVETVIKDAWDETVTKFNPGLMIDAIKDGALIGAGVGVADALHEAAQTTYINDATPGRPEEVTPEAKDTFDMIAEKLQTRADKERELNEQEEEHDDEEFSL